ncbi:MAG: sugar phosphate isomerase/epimerase [Oscillospiraceae bacterium]|nr:sugar phosphate isomerase/epimerase [Oscillospiraceae bacterium]
MIKKAVQQIMLGTVTRSESEAGDTLAAIKLAGYDAVELNGFMIRPTSIFVRALTKAAGMPVGRGGAFDWHGLLRSAGLGVVSVHEDLGTIKTDPDRVIAEAASFGTKYVVITGMYNFDYSDTTALSSLCDDLNKYGAILAEGGVSLLYHNHNCELRRAGDTTAYEYIMSRTDPEKVNFEFDSYWFTDAGADAGEWMKRLGARMKLWHVNDRGIRMKGKGITPILKADSMELGYGNMPLDRLTEAAKNCGIDAVILESHKNWADGSPIKSLQLSSAFLNSNFR